MQSAQPVTIPQILSQLKQMGIEISPASMQEDARLECTICYQFEDIQTPLGQFITAGCCGKFICLGCDIKIYRSMVHGAQPLPSFDAHQYKCAGCSRDASKSMDVGYQMLLRTVSTYITTSLFVYLKLNNNINDPIMRKLFLLTQQQVVLKIITKKVDLPPDTVDTMHQLSSILRAVATFIKGAGWWSGPELERPLYNLAITYFAESFAVYERMRVWLERMPSPKRHILSTHHQWMQEILDYEKHYFSASPECKKLDYECLLMNLVFFASPAALLERSLHYMLNDADLEEPFCGFQLTPAQNAQLNNAVAQVLPQLRASDWNNLLVVLEALRQLVAPIARSLYATQSQAGELYNFKQPSGAAPPQAPPLMVVHGDQALRIIRDLGLDPQGFLNGRHQIDLDPRMEQRLQRHLAPPQAGYLDWLSWPVLLGMTALVIAYLMYQQNNLPPPR